MECRSDANVIFASSTGEKEPEVCIDFTWQDKGSALAADSEVWNGRNKTRADLCGIKQCRRTVTNTKRKKMGGGGAERRAGKWRHNVRAHVRSFAHRHRRILSVTVSLCLCLTGCLSVCLSRARTRARTHTHTDTHTRTNKRKSRRAYENQANNISSKGRREGRENGRT